MTNISNLKASHRFLQRAVLVLTALVALVLSTAGQAQSLIPGNYYWYAPEHEKYAPTTFYGEPRFDSRTIRVKSTQRFKLLGGSKGWLLIQFDIAGKVYIHTRLMRNMMYVPGSGDPVGEFQRASVFDEDPSKIEARLYIGRTDPKAAESDSKVPSWKRYKDSWGLKQGRTSTLPSATTGDAATADAASTPLPTRPQEKKAKSKYSLLPPIGSEPAQPPSSNTDPEAAPPPDGTNVPMPRLP